MVLEGAVLGSYRPETVRRVLQDLDGLAHTVPGISDLTWDGDRFTGVMTVKLPFTVLKSRMTGSVTRSGNGAVALTVKGQPQGLAGLYQAEVALSPVLDGERRGIRWRLEMTLFGRLASLGDAMLGTVSRQNAAVFEQHLAELLAREDA